MTTMKLFINLCAKHAKCLKDIAFMRVCKPKRFYTVAAAKVNTRSDSEIESKGIYTSPLKLYRTQDELTECLLDNTLYSDGSIIVI